MMLSCNASYRTDIRRRDEPFDIRIDALWTATAVAVIELRAAVSLRKKGYPWFSLCIDSATATARRRGRLAVVDVKAMWGRVTLVR